MRAVSKKINVVKSVVSEEDVYKEKITKIVELPEIKNIEVTIAYLNQEENLISENIFLIEGADYDFLFSDDIIFDDGKQKGSYREEDLWKVIDKLISNA
ncbi:hypothetical protein [Enterococcus diestrammenae]|uniref:Uncharacterized protein n=1 Tax=Enterococcus diestrammenae TaxID=1155073 RepID=A0ABV0F1S3_9ENTE|nr:hypothetical protein [Enterococcus diestrammenae]KAF1294810.1 hypothetical protein BAU18_03665 [Enterococcus diestrammenae]